MTKSLSCIFYQGARQIAQADFCTVKFYCRAPSRITHGEHALLCVTCSTVKKTNDTARETASNRLCRAPGTGRTANNETFVVHLTLARTANKRKKYNSPPEQRQASHHRVWNAACRATTTSPVLTACRRLESRAAAASMRQACCRPPSEEEGGVVHHPGSGLCAMDEEVGYRGEEATAPAATRRIGPQHVATATCKRRRKMREMEGGKRDYLHRIWERGRERSRPHRCWGSAAPRLRASRAAQLLGPPRLRGWSVGSAVVHRRSQHAAEEGGIAGHKHRRRRLQASVHLELKVAARIWLAADLGGGGSRPPRTGYGEGRERRRGGSEGWEGAGCTGWEGGRSGGRVGFGRGGRYLYKLLVEL